MTTDTNLLGLIIVASPLIFAFIIERWPVNGLLGCGVVAIYAGAVSVAFIPLLGVIVSVGFIVCGILMVAIGGSLKAVLLTLERAPIATGEAIDEILSVRARSRERDGRQ